MAAVQPRTGAAENGLPDGFGGSLPARIHELLEQAIIEGVFAPGTRMHADKLAAQYGVSRIPVREALRSLHEAGWVDIRPRYGVYVRDRSERELRELFETRAVIESSIAGWAAERRSTDDLARLDRVIEEGRRAAGGQEPTRLLALSSEFYAALRQAAHNEVMAGVSAELEKRARFYFSMVAADLGGDWASKQEKLAALVAAQDVAGAAAESRRHIVETGEAVARLLAHTEPA
ncbi:GntR family transcriptional regulator [Micromonospora sp. RP3T]|uniref:GntR family transcriptional regulator n=1 Tax=Micromonospora sp. RP3T TaxID=2135446 RepID=UPI000D15ED56|nr:GntR family transcriptional regulator [Micromonospora sp. RP3T]PTA47494.1 GntR family transcriptional regulator [Micromonospora sp. RP3T]